MMAHQDETRRWMRWWDWRIFWVVLTLTVLWRAIVMLNGFIEKP